MTAQTSTFRTPLTTVIVAVLLAGCGYHSEYHRAGVAHRSIKDDPAPGAQRPIVHKIAAAAPTRPIEKPVSHAAAEAPTTSRPVAVRSEPSSPAEPVVKQTPSVTARVEAPAPSAPVVKSTAVEAPSVIVTVPAPPITVPIAPPVIAAAPSPPPPAPVVAIAPPTPAEQRPIIDLRRAAPPAATTAPASPSAAQAPAAPAAPVAAAEPQPVKPMASAILIQPKAPAAVESPAQPKVAALTDEQRVRDTVTRAQDYLRTNRIVNARALLQDAARDNHPALLVALAETYDPKHLREKHPNLARAAEPARALDLYRRASEQGSTAAADKMKSLSDFLAANPGVVRQ